MLYTHYKGGLYRVLYEAVHTETNEDMTVYMSIKDGAIWIRPTSMFHELVQMDDDTWVPRFTTVKEPTDKL